jgi:hypothetical protein
MDMQDAQGAMIKKIEFLYFLIGTTRRIKGLGRPYPNYSKDHMFLSSQEPSFFVFLWVYLFISWRTFFIKKIRPLAI